MPVISLPNSEQLERLIEVVGGDKDVYGIHWDKIDDVITRVKGAVGLTQSDFNNIAPWSNMRRWTVNDRGVVKSYYGYPNYIEDGSIGQVMVEMQKFWYRTFTTQTGYQFEISPNEKSGFKVHPAFIKGAETLDRVFVSAFEGSIYDTSASAYLLADEQIADFTATTGKLPFTLFRTKPCNASPSTSSAIIRRGCLDCITFSRIGMSSLRDVNFLSTIKTLASLYEAIILSELLTK